MQEKLTQILNDIYALDPALREQDEQVRTLVSAFLAQKPQVEITTAFKQNLRASLVNTKSSERPVKALPWWTFYVAPLGVAALIILMLIPDYDPDFAPSAMPRNQIEINNYNAQDEASVDVFGGAADSNAVNTKRSATPAEESAAMMMVPEMDSSIPSKSLLVSTQEPGNVIVVDFVSLLVPGYVVIHTEDSGEMGEIIGASAVLPDGLSEMITIQLPATTMPDQTFFAVLYFDNGDGVFDPEVDLPVYDSSQTLPVYQMFSTTPATPF
jgi:hypothetical protein